MAPNHQSSLPIIFLTTLITIIIINSTPITASPPQAPTPLFDSPPPPPPSPPPPPPRSRPRRPSPPPATPEQLNNISHELIGAGDFENWVNIITGANPLVLTLSATLFIPQHDALNRLPTSDPLMFPNHVVPQRLTFADLQLFKPNSRLPTLLTGKSILITNNSRSNFTVDDSPLTQPDLYLTTTVAVHGLGAILDYSVYGDGLNLLPSPNSEHPPPQGGVPPTGEMTRWRSDAAPPCLCFEFPVGFLFKIQRNAWANSEQPPRVQLRPPLLGGVLPTREMTRWRFNAAPPCLCICLVACAILRVRTKKMIALVLLVLLYGASGQPIKHPQLKHYVLALTWPSGFCQSIGFQQCRQPIQQRFLIHGVWPECRGSNHLGSQVQLPAQWHTKLSKDMLHKLLRDWPAITNGVVEDLTEASAAQWSHQWRKKGSLMVSGGNPWNSISEYLSKGLELYNRCGRSLLQTLGSKRITPGDGIYVLEDLIKAIMESCHVNVTIQCKPRTSDGRNLITGILVCLDRNGYNFIDCDKKEQNCVKKVGPLTTLTLPGDPSVVADSEL